MGSDMQRREFITLIGTAVAAWPLTARAQQPDRMRRIGVLMGLAEDDPDTKARLAELRQGLERLGWSEGRNVRVDYRFAPAGTQAQVLAKELVALQPDVVICQASPATSALQRETRTIPIVFVGVADPIGSGFVVSLAQPGGNITGFLLFEASITGKWLAMLRDIAPNLARALLVINPKTAVYYNFYLPAARAAASSLGIELVLAPIENAPANIERSFEAFARAPNSGLILLPDTNTTLHRDLIIRLAAQHRLPAVYTDRLFVVAGGLMCYGTDRADQFRQAASYVDRILRGAKPADLPVQAPTKYETVINLKTAKALGLTVPPALLVAADEVIE
jgi:putative ABC transport system substrate-binding protein